MTFPRTPTRAVRFVLACFAVALIAVAPLPAQNQPVRATPAPASTGPAPSVKTRASRTPKPKAAAAAAFNTSLILLDPAHGGSDPGGSLGPNLAEKDVTLAFANRLRPLLAARGFSVVFTREADPPAPQPAAASTASDEAADHPAPPPPPPQVTPDQRAELANRIHPFACILIHATASGRGVHLYNSSLSAPPPSDEPRPILPWDNAQALILTQSLAMSGDLAQALNGTRIPLVTGRVSIRPIDSLTCPAVAIELAPTADPAHASDLFSQQRVAEAVAEAMVLWRAHAQAFLDAQAQASAGAAPAKPDAAKPDVTKSDLAKPDATKPGEAPAAKPKPRPKPKPVIPVPVPDPAAETGSPPPGISTPGNATPGNPAPGNPAPIVRQPPPSAGAPK